MAPIIRKSSRSERSSDNPDFNLSLPLDSNSNPRSVPPTSPISKQIEKFSVPPSQEKIKELSPFALRNDVLNKTVTRTIKRYYKDAFSEFRLASKCKNVNRKDSAGRKAELQLAQAFVEKEVTQSY